MEGFRGLVNPRGGGEVLHSGGVVAAGAAGAAASSEKSRNNALLGEVDEAKDALERSRAEGKQTKCAPPAAAGGFLARPQLPPAAPSRGVRAPVPTTATRRDERRRGAGGCLPEHLKLHPKQLVMARKEKLTSMNTPTKLRRISILCLGLFPTLTITGTTKTRMRHFIEMGQGKRCDAPLNGRRRRGGSRCQARGGRCVAAIRSQQTTATMCAMLAAVFLPSRCLEAGAAARRRGTDWSAICDGRRARARVRVRRDEIKRLRREYMSLEEDLATLQKGQGGVRPRMDLHTGDLAPCLRVLRIIDDGRGLGRRFENAIHLIRQMPHLPYILHS